jgi:ABC-type phosphate transport system ATPase subunit
MRRMLPFLSVALFIGLIYNGVVFYSRWSANREVERKQEEKQAEDARRTLDQLRDLKSELYAAPAQIKRGGQTRLCYATIGAKTVRIDPPVGEVWPALGRCVEVSPRSTTVYTLVAEDGSGHRVTSTATVTVSR